MLRSAAAHLLRSWVRIPSGAWMFVCCELSGRGLCDELITCPEESYRLCCVVVCDLETSRIGAPYIYYISHLRVKQPCLDNHSKLDTHLYELSHKDPYYHLSKYWRFFLNHPVYLYFLWLRFYRYASFTRSKRLCSFAWWSSVAVTLFFFINVSFFVS